MTNRMPAALLGGAWLLTAGLAGAVVTNSADVCVYGGTAGGVVAAVQAARMGKSVRLVVANNHLGGMTSGGLGWTDAGTAAAIGGLSREFYTRIAAKYGVAGQKYTFEPHVAEAVFNELIAETAVGVHPNQPLADVTLAGTNIVALRTVDGTVFKARAFIDASYEGDLLARAGVTCTYGREANARYGETLNGARTRSASHQFTVNVDPYLTPGNAASGLLPLVQADAAQTQGTADRRIQAYNFRLCLTRVASNRLDWVAPAGYDPARYELLARYLEARTATVLGNLLKIDAIPNGKTDVNNNGAISTDYIGGSWDYPAAGAARRAQLWEEHKAYTQGLLYFLATSPRVPASVRTNLLAYGLCKDEFTDTGGWPHQLYVREARRMVADYVMTQRHCTREILPADSVGLASYTMDSHNCTRYVAGGYAVNEGDVQQAVPGPYRVAYRALVPRRGECRNLLVPWSLSATHIAFGSIRMEPVFMVLGQSAATAACQALDAGVAVQDVDVAALQARLLADGQVLTWGTTANQPPVVELTLPRMDARYPPGSNVVLEAAVSDADGSIARVEFLAGAVVIGQASAAPYRLVWTNPVGGLHPLAARAVDNEGATNVSGVVPVEVGPAPGHGSPELGIIADNADAAHVTLVGDWTGSVTLPGYYGANYIHDGNTNKGAKSVRFAPELPLAGLYDVYVRFTADNNRATNVPVDFEHADGTQRLFLNERATYLSGQWVWIGAARCPAGAGAAVTFRNDNTDGYVIADAVSFVPVTATNAAAHALVVESFNGYGVAELDRLDGLNGGTGWQGAWTGNAGDAPGYECMGPNGSLFAGAAYAHGGNGVDATDGRAIIRASDTSSRLAYRTFDQGLTGTVWLSALVRHETNDTGDVLLWFETMASGSQANTFVGLRNGDQPMLRYQGTNLVAADLNSARQALLFLARLTLDEGGMTADRVEFWIKRATNDVSSVAALGEPLLSSSGADLFGPELKYIALSGAVRSGNVDALRLSDRATAFADVVTGNLTNLFATAFAGTEGTLPTNWVALVGNTGTPGWRLDAAGDLRFDQDAFYGVACYTGPLADGRDPRALTNVLIETTFRKDVATLAGFVARAQDGQNFYHARLMGGNQLQMWKCVGGTFTQLGGTATIRPAYVAGETWRLRFRLEGAVLTADLFNPAGACLGAVAAVDTTFTAGKVGLRVGRSTAVATFSVAAERIVRAPAPPEATGTLLIVR